MSENSEQTIPQTEQLTDSVLDIGAMLTKARERRGLSVEEAALQLRLGPRQLQALENNDYASLPGITFVRGFLRNYARLLGLDTESLMQALSKNTEASAQQSISLRSEKIALVSRDKKPWLSYVVASVLVGLALGGWMAYMDYRESLALSPAAKVAEPIVGKPVDMKAANLDLPELATLQDVQPATEKMTSLGTATADASGVAVPVAAAPVVAEPVAITAGSIRVKFIINELSWIGVVDRDGNEIFNKTKATGSEDMAEGLPPLKISIGNAAGVQMTFNDKPVDLAPYTKGNVARLALE